MSPIQLRRMLRKKRVEIRKERISRGLTERRAKRIWSVRLSVISLPQWAIDRQYKELPHSDFWVWLKPGDARALVKLDEIAGGEPDVMVMECRRCRFCKRLLLDADAWARRKLDQSWMGEWTGCGPGCSQIGWAKKGIRCE